MRLATVFLFLLITLVVVELSETARRGGRGGGGRGGGSRGGGSRGGSRGRSSSRSRSSRSRSSSKPKITKNTPIKPTSVRSPVIIKQTKLGSRSSTFKKVVAAYLVHRYVFSSAPVYRHGYPLYRSYVSIPKDRAVRVTYEEEKLLDDEGKLCLGESKESRTLKEGIDENLVELNTTVKYSDGTTVKLYGSNNTVSLEDIKDKDFEVTSRARYNSSILMVTNCTQIEKTVKGTMVTLYETNPNGASQLHLNNKLLQVFIVLFALINMFSV